MTLFVMGIPRATWNATTNGEFPADVQEPVCSRTVNRFASHGKEQIRERRERALASPVPLMRVNDLSLVKRKWLIDAGRKRKCYA